MMQESITTGNQAIRVAMINLCPGCNEAFNSCVEQDPHLVAVFVSHDHEHAVASIIASQADVVILDVDLPNGTAFEIAAQVRRQLPSSKIMFVDGGISDLCIRQALGVGVNGYVSNDQPIECLVDAVKRVVAGETVFSSAIEERLTYHAPSRRHKLRFDMPLCGLTNRQLDVLRLLASGDSVKIVAKKMHLSYKAVDSQKYRMMRKLGIGNVVGLARYAIREGLIRP